MTPPFLYTTRAPKKHIYVGILHISVQFVWFVQQYKIYLFIGTPTPFRALGKSALSKTLLDLSTTGPSDAMWLEDI